MFGLPYEQENRWGVKQLAIFFMSRAVIVECKEDGDLPSQIYVQAI
jgi:hypothetical protein